MSMKLKNIFLVVAALSLTSCIAARVKKDAKLVRITKTEPQTCKYKGESIGSQGNSITGKYTMVSSMQKGAMNRLKNKAHKLGGDTVFILDTKQIEGVTKKGKKIIRTITITGGVYDCAKSSKKVGF